MPKPDSRLWEVPPTVFDKGTTYRVRYHPGGDRRFSDGCWVDLLVDDNDYAQVTDFYWFGKFATATNGRPLSPSSHRNFETYREIMDWLMEWELLEWRPIGPEDREPFATDKLRGGFN